MLYLGRRGGLSQYSFELARALSRRTRLTCYISAFNPHAADWQRLPCATQLFPTYTNLPTLLWSLVRCSGPRHVAAAIDHDNPDLLLDTGTGPWAKAIRSNLRRPVLTAQVIHDVEYHPDRWRLLARVNEWLNPREGDALIGVSEHGARELRRRYRSTRCLQSTHGILLAADRIDIDRIVANRRQLLFFGRIERYKGVDILIDAFELAYRHDRRLSLSIAGSGPIPTRVRRTLGSLPITLHNGWMSEADIARLLLDHGVMILPYVSATQSGVAAIALGNGLPMIATDVGALGEQVVDDFNGLLVPPRDANALADAILKLSSDAPRVRRFSESALSMARCQYAWDHIADRLVADVHALVRERQAATSLHA